MLPCRALPPWRCRRCRRCWLSTLIDTTISLRHYFFAD
jgi:hypothetical protein